MFCETQHQKSKKVILLFLVLKPLPNSIIGSNQNQNLIQTRFVILCGKISLL